MKRLILNADDFGLAAPIDDAVIAAAREGCLTSTTLCVTGPTATHAASAARSVPRLGVGLHVTLVDERPAARVNDVGTLVDDEGFLPRSGVEFARRWFAGLIDPHEVRREVSAQWDRFEDLELQPTHFDSHDHVHVLPGVLEICLEEAALRSVRRLRVPHERTPIGSASTVRRLFGTCLRSLAWRAARVATAHGFEFPGVYSGYRGAGAIDTESLERRIRMLRPGTTEIGMHPATAAPPRPDMGDWGYDWVGEYEALTAPSVRHLLQQNGVELVDFRDPAALSDAAA